MRSTQQWNDPFAMAMGSADPALQAIVVLLVFAILTLPLWVVIVSYISTTLCRDTVSQHKHAGQAKANSPSSSSHQRSPSPSSKVSSRVAMYTSDDLVPSSSVAAHGNVNTSSRKKESFSSPPSREGLRSPTYNNLAVSQLGRATPERERDKSQEKSKGRASFTDIAASGPTNTSNSYSTNTSSTNTSSSEGAMSAMPTTTHGTHLTNPRTRPETSSWQPAKGSDAV